MRNVLIFCLVFGFCIGCGGGRKAAQQAAQQQPEGNYTTLEGMALGTTYRIVVGTADTAGMARTIDSLFAEVDNSLSIYNPDSRINMINNNLTDSIDVHIYVCLEAALRASELSGGLYDITVKPLTDALGFGSAQKWSDGDVKKQYLRPLLKHVGYKKIRMDVPARRIIKDDPRVQIDLNSVAKGYTVDLIFRTLLKQGIADIMVEVGGEIRCEGESPRGTPWRLGIDRPEEGNMIPGQKIQSTVLLSGAAMATSGNYRRYYTDADGQKVGHTINPLTGESRPGSLLSASVIYVDAASADALATMLMAMGFEAARDKLRETGIAGYLVFRGEDGEFKTWMSPSFWEYLEK